MSKKLVRSALRVAALAVVVAAGTLGPAPVAQAAKPIGGGGSGCPRDVYCIDLWDPVICSDGQVYSNSCYAYRACATGCVPYGDGGPVEL